VIGETKNGQFVLFASHRAVVRRDIAKWLAEQVGATTALNLDGGPEVTLSLKDEPPEYSIGGQGVGLPIVLIVRAR
jgi:hypothetical protein